MLNGGTWMFAYHIDNEKFCDALSKMLEEYPVFGGRMTGADVICGNNSGVWFELAERPNLTCKDVAAMPCLPKYLQATSSCSAFMKGKIPPLSVKQTLLADGTVMSFAVNHACADGATLYQLVDDLAKIYCEHPVEPFVFDQKYLPEPKWSKEELIGILPERGWFPVGLKNLVSFFVSRVRHTPERAVFIPAGILDSCKKRCQEILGEPVSTHVLLCAFVVKLVAEAEQSWPETEFSIVSTVDLRGRIGIPANFGGNAVLNVSVPYFAVGERSLPDIVKAIGQGMVRALQPDKLEQDFLLNLSAMNHVVPFVGFDLSATSKRFPHCILVNNFCKFPIYAVDFGGGTPLRAWPNDLPDVLKIWPAISPEKGVLLLCKDNLARLVGKLERNGELEQLVANIVE